MSENETRGGARPALAAHSKDAAGQGETPTSNTRADTGHPEGGPSSSPGGLAQEGSGRIASSIPDVGKHAKEGVSGQAGPVADRVATFLREQMLTALALAGGIGIALGISIARRKASR